MSKINWGKILENKNQLKVTIFVFLGLFGISAFVIFIYWVIWADISPAWTGFGKRTIDPTIQPTKNLWDWMDLLIVPLILALGLYWLNYSARKNELEIAEKARLNEQQIARNNQNQITLKAYIEQMAELLLNHNLLESNDGDHIRSIARAKTLMAFRDLDGTRKGHLLVFLYESGLIYKGNTIISLAGANLRKIQLENCRFENICLSKVDLSGANLSGSSLSNLDLTYANLSKANLHGIYLSDSSAYGANFQNSNLSNSYISQNKMRQIDFSEAKLQNTILRVNEFNYSNFSKSLLTESIIVKSNLSYCKLIEAHINSCNIFMSAFNSSDLTNSILANSAIKSTRLDFANLTGAILDEVDMRRANWHDVQPHLSKIMVVQSSDYIVTTVTSEQLSQTKSLINAIMPDGNSYEIWKREQITQAEKEETKSTKV